MNPTQRRSWFPPAVLLGAVYAAVGIGFALPATHPRAWRLAAWVVSGLAYAAHLGYERFRSRSSPGSAALHVAVAAGLGGLGLAIGALIHSVARGMPIEHQLRLLIALAVWPLVTGVPAFLLGLVVSGALVRATRTGRGETGSHAG